MSEDEGLRGAARRLAHKAGAAIDAVEDVVESAVKDAMRPDDEPEQDPRHRPPPEDDRDPEHRQHRHPPEDDRDPAHRQHRHPPEDDRDPAPPRGRPGTGPRPGTPPRAGPRPGDAPGAEPSEHRDSLCGCGHQCCCVHHCCCAPPGCCGGNRGEHQHGHHCHRGTGSHTPAQGGGARGRPTRTPGHDRGGLDGSPVTVGEVTGKHPKDSWPGPRKDLPMPFLFLRANPGDTGTRPAVGAFWESPDVLLLAGVHPTGAPPIPPQLGQTALAGQPNTVYAHVWNFGHRGAYDVVVEFYWCNPTLGFNPNSAHLIGRGYTHLGARGSGHAHHVVKCPEPWIPTFVNGGHECLLIRAWDNVGDLLTTPEWDAAANRHIGQRNVHVVAAADAGSLAAQPLKITVGALFGEPATVRVQREHPANVPWLQLRTGVRGGFPAPAPATGTLGLGLGSGAPAESHQVEGDGAHVTLHSTDGPPAPGTAHVYRVTGSQGGTPFGGYTVIVMG